MMRRQRLSLATPWCALVAASCALVACGDDDAPPPPVVDAGLDAGADAGVDLGPPPPSRVAAVPVRQWVDPRIGTGGDGFSVGSANPGPQRPFGMVRPGPDTSLRGGAPGFYHCSGYYADDDEIFGFSHTRMPGVGIVDYGAVAVMPLTGMSAARIPRAGHTARFAKESEEVSAGYYAVTLEGAMPGEDAIRVELSATDRVAVHRWTWAPGADAVAMFDIAHTFGASGDVEILDGSIRIDTEAGELSGFAFFRGGYSGRFGGLPVHFVARFSQPFSRFGVWSGGVLAEGETERGGADTGAYVGFDVTDGAPVEAAVAISFVDVDHARMNLAAEQAVIDFDATRTAAEEAWETLLSRVSIEGRSERDFRRFYTALYHALVMPTLMSDVDGSYRGMDRAVHVVSGWRYHSDFSLWDTFRTLHPLLTLLYPEHQTELLRSLAQMAIDGGYIDKWPLADGYTGGMVGESATIVIADSVAKGLTDFDVRAAYDSLRETADGPTPPGARYGGRGNVADYLALGYIPEDTGGSSVSKTLEYAYDDWALARMAEHLGETADAARYQTRSGNWRNHLDPTSGYLIGRRRDGSFPPVETTTEWSEWYAEGNVMQYTYYVPHDLPGLAAAMGGRDALLGDLETLFERTRTARRGIGPERYYWHGNEPDLHYSWMYAALGRPEGTQRWSRWIVENRYGDGPDGLPGNDDAGTLSAWLVFAMSGFYSLAGAPDYLVGSPVLTRVQMRLPGGDFVIEAPDASASAQYVRGVTLDGVPLSRARVTHADVADGATLRLAMSDTPADWGRE
jgi:predicted alpha-1,2-mannosidase